MSLVVTDKISNSILGGAVPSMGQMGGKTNFGQPKSIPTNLIFIHYSIQISSKSDDFFQKQDGTPVLIYARLKKEH